MAKKCGTQDEHRQNSNLPELAACRAVRFGTSDDMIYCLRDNADNCRYALHFGSGFFCHHPNRAEIVTRTRTAAKK